jgi:hypothetical protein
MTLFIAHGGSVDVGGGGGIEGFSGCWRPNVAGYGGYSDERYQAHVFDEPNATGGRSEAKLGSSPWTEARGET